MNSFSLGIAILIAGFLFLASSCKDPAPSDNKPPEQMWEWTVDTLVYDGPSPAPDQINIQCIWGSSGHDVLAVGTSDDILGEVWHYDGVKWHVVTERPYNGIDTGGSFLNDVFAVSGFDSANVFLFGHHGYFTTGTDLILKWNGHTWSTLPWEGGKAPTGALTWGVKQNNDKLWAVGSLGEVVEYTGQFLSVDTIIPGYRFWGPVIAALDGGEVYLNAYRDSVQGDTLPVGRSTKLYQRDLSGHWWLIEEKFVVGGWDDGNGLGSGLLSVGDRLFTPNRGLWERIGTSWVQRTTFSGDGGSCLVSDLDMWIYYLRSLWHFDGHDWKTIDVPLLSGYTRFYLYGQGWSNGKEIFISLTENGMDSFILHGRLKGG